MHGEIQCMISVQEARLAEAGEDVDEEDLLEAEVADEAAQDEEIGDAEGASPGDGTMPGASVTLLAF